MGLQVKKYPSKAYSWLLPVGLVLIAVLWIYQEVRLRNLPYRISQSEKIFLRLDEEVRQTLSESVIKADPLLFHERIVHASSAERGLSYFVFQEGKLTLWSDNEPDLSAVSPDSLRDGSLVQLPNGLFWVRRLASGPVVSIGLLLVHHSYAYQNQYLANEFNPVLKLPAGSELIASEGLPFHAPDGKVIFQLKTEGHSGERHNIFLHLFWGLAILMVLSGLTIRFNRPTSHPSLAISGIFLLLILRSLMLVLHVPSVWYESELFSPSVYASSYLFNSLGDLLLNAVFFFCCALLISRVIASRRNKPSAAAWPFALLISAVFVYLLHVLIKGLVLDSRISFDISHLPSVSAYSLLGLLAVGLMFFSSGMILLSFLKGMTGKPQKFRHAVIALFMVSIYVSSAIYYFNLQKEEADRMQLALRAGMEQDHIAEYLFDAEAGKIALDAVIADWIRKRKSGDEISARMSTKYMSSYLGKYELSVAVFDTAGKSVSGAQPPLSDLRDQLLTGSEPTLSPLLFRIPGEAGRIQYVSLIPVNDSHGLAGTLVVFLRSRFFPSGQGFPELFVSGAVREQGPPDNYSYARYKNGSLLYEYGSYAYKFTDHDFAGTVSDEFGWTTSDGFNHLTYRPAAGSLIVVSRASGTWVEAVTLFSWVFTLFSLFFGLVYFIRRAGGKMPAHGALTRRIQWSVFILVALSFIVIGTGTVLYIYKKYDTDQQRDLSEQANGLWILLGDQVDLGVPLTRAGGDTLSGELQKVAANTNIDFNIYNEQGGLYYSSQPRIYEQGIISDKMNPLALHELKAFGKTQYIHRENVGRLKYLAAYAPFTAPGGEITGFLHLPYFEKQTERNREVSGFLSAILNIYVLLFAFAVFVTAFISTRITQPLLIIQERLAGIRFGKKNEPIQYSAPDEIGQLVVEYNRMVKELSDSAEKLARSERESAWREMAKQVAHEIKNPLTPMKLSVQHLQRAWKEKQEGREELVERVAQTLVQQIDTLANIANEFSNFAKMPQAHPERIDMKEIAGRVAELFRESYAVGIRFEAPTEGCFIMADKDQFNRVISNLLKNAVQAIPDETEGLIRIRIERRDGKVVVSVSDNGAGIPDELRSKIFVPNFTTKSGGTGLGLAMVKNIVEQAGGSVRFESETGKGTTFRIDLPEATTESEL